MKILKILIFALVAISLHAQVKPEWTIYGNEFFYVNEKLDVTKKMNGFTNMSFLQNGAIMFVLSSGPVTIYDGSFHSTEKITYESSNPKTEMPKKGLSEVVGAVTDKHGDIWYGTGSGLYRIPAPLYSDLRKMASQPDGQGVWISDDTEGMPFGMVTHLAKDSNGNIWVVGGKKRGSDYVASGISKFDGTSWQNFFPEGSESKLISYLGTDRFGGVWTVSSDTKINYFQNGAWKAFTETNSKTNVLLVDELNNIYAGTNGGLLIWKENKWQPLKISGLPEYAVQDIVFDKKGNLWIGTNYGAYCLNKEGGVYQLNVDNSPLVSNLITKIVVDAQDKKWFITSAGVVGFKEPEISHMKNVFTKYNSGYIDGEVESTSLYHDGFLFVNNEEGLIKYDGKSFTRVTPTDQREVTHNGITVDKNGVAFMGTYRFIHKYDGNNYEKWEWKDETGKQVNSLLFDDQSTLWIASKGVSKYNGSSWQTFDKKNAGLSSNSALQLFKDSKGNVWVALSDGVAKYDGSSWSTYTKKTSGVALGNMKSIAETSDNRILFSNGYSLIEFNGTTVKEVSGFKNVGDLRNMIITEDGTLLMATTDKGIGKFKDGVLTYLTDLPSKEINYIFKDKSGNVWAAFGSKPTESSGFPAMGTTPGQSAPAESPSQVFDKKLKRANVFYGMVKIN